MITVETLQKIFEDINNIKGEKVKIKTNIGRKRVDVKEGIIYEVFDNHFTVMIDLGQETERLHSVSYIDLITKHVLLYRKQDETENNINDIEDEYKVS